MNKPLITHLPADLPEDWQLNQKVSPTGTDVGLTLRHGYNYLNEQVNDTQKNVNKLNDAFIGVQELIADAPSTTTVADTETVPIVEPVSKFTKKITFANLITAIITRLRNTFAALVHTHGNITNDGKVGSVANRAVMTDIGGTMIAGTLPVAGGGTGATTAAAARASLAITPANIGAAPVSHNHDASNINSGVLAIARGGTGVGTLNVNKLKTDTSSDTLRQIYLSPSGNDNNDGLTTTTAMKTIRAAVGRYGGLNRLQLVMLDGTYTDTATVVISGSQHITISSNSQNADKVIISHPIIFQSVDAYLYQVTFDLSASTLTDPAVSLRQSKYNIQACKFRGKTGVHTCLNASLGSSGYLASCTLLNGKAGIDVGSGASMTILGSTFANVLEVGINVNGGLLLSGGNSNLAATPFTMQNSAVIFNDGVLLNPVTTTVSTAVLEN